jgi:hypothetical protein
MAMCESATRRRRFSVNWSVNKLTDGYLDCIHFLNRWFVTEMQPLQKFLKSRKGSQFQFVRITLSIMCLWNMWSVGANLNVISFDILSFFCFSWRGAAKSDDNIPPTLQDPFYLSPTYSLQKWWVPKS